MSWAVIGKPTYPGSEMFVRDKLGFRCSEVHELGQSECHRKSASCTRNKPSALILTTPGTAFLFVVSVELHPYLLLHKGAPCKDSAM